MEGFSPFALIWKAETTEGPEEPDTPSEPEDPEVPESSGPLLCPEGSKDISICDYAENLLRIFVSISDINKEMRL